MREDGEIGSKSREEGEIGSESREKGDLLPCSSPIISFSVCSHPISSRPKHLRKDWFEKNYVFLHDMTVNLSNFLFPKRWQNKVQSMGRVKNILLVFGAIILTVLLLKRILGIYGIIVPLLYMFFDVNWSLRVTWIVLRKIILGRKASRGFLDSSVTSFVVLPPDVDLNLHMNNAR